MSDTADFDDWLTNRSADQLAVILDVRPDVLWGAPLRGLDDLSARLSMPSSVLEAVTDLPLPGIQLLQALAASGPYPSATSVAAIMAADDRSPEQQLAAVRGILELLEQYALAWPDGPDAIALNPGVGLLIDEPLGLGRTVAAHLANTPLAQLREIVRHLELRCGSRREEVIDALVEFLTDHRLVRELVATAPEVAQRRLLAMSRRDSESHDPRIAQQREGENWSRQRGLVFGGPFYGTEVPVEVTLALRPDELRVTFTPDPPQMITGDVPPESLTGSAGAAAGEFTETVAGLLDSLAREPMAELKIGGIGNREIARIAKSLGTDDMRIRLALEITARLGLLDSDGSKLFSSDQAVSWRAGEPSARWCDLAAEWWHLDTAPTVTRDADGKVVNALGRGSGSEESAQLRWAVISAIASVQPGRGLPGPGPLIDLMRWLQPSAIGPGDPVIAAIWQEAHTLGVLAQGAITPLGTALINADLADLTAVAADLLLPATTTGTFGSDLTVMVAGAPSAAVSRLLDSCADRESRGAAAIWRFSPASVRRAFDQGASADELIRALAAVAGAELPQPLTYVIRDVERRHGVLVVQPVASCVRSDDEALLIEVAAHRSLRMLGPHLLAPTVIAFQSDESTVLAALRAAGYMPTASDGAGHPQLVRLSAATPERGSDTQLLAGARAAEHFLTAEPVGPPHVPGGMWARNSSPGGNDRADAALQTPSPGKSHHGKKPIHELAQALLSSAGRSNRGERSETEAAVEAFGARIDPVQQRQLAFAIDQQVPVKITYQSASGGITTRVISDIEMVNGTLYAWCHLRDDDRVFSVDRIQAVAPVDA